MRRIAVDRLEERPVDEHLAAGLDDAVHLAHHEPGLAGVLQDREGPDAVDRVVLDGIGAVRLDDQVGAPGPVDLDVQAVVERPVPQAAAEIDVELPGVGGELVLEDAVAGVGALAGVCREIVVGCADDEGKCPVRRMCRKRAYREDQ
jgi:hypothetical protein